MGTIMKFIKKILNYAGFEISRIENLSLLQNPKYKAELIFWKNILIEYLQKETKKTKYNDKQNPLILFLKAAK